MERREAEVEAVMKKVKEKQKTEGLTASEGQQLLRNITMSGYFIKYFCFLPLLPGYLTESCQLLTWF